MPDMRQFKEVRVALPVVAVVAVVAADDATAFALSGQGVRPVQDCADRTNWILDGCGSFRGIAELGRC
ncbi:DUF6207 family protein [Streptomyces sp. NPDC050535]|uniref:DUF6207 family protein n=1 Tax=Streptomyces sp. NPDC050535 TaxID=3365626 RepID=UPI00378C0F0F